MEFVNATSLAAGWTMGFDRDGRELAVVAVKSTYSLPRSAREAPVLAEQQVQLVTADEFSGEPGLSAPVHEADYAHRKPLCDVLLNGSAYAPAGKMVRRLGVGLRVGAMVKTFDVVGHRVWRRSPLGTRPGEPDAFEMMPISYSNAFGGTQVSPRDPAQVNTFLENPVGRSYAPEKENLDGRSLPNTEEPGKPVAEPGKTYRAMSFGSIGRNWSPRVQFAGTYDQQWLDREAPFWPQDFDYRYFQAAPPEQQIPYLRGGEEVTLKNLTPDGRLTFTLPPAAVSVWFLPYRGRDVRVDGVVDTLLIEPDLQRFTMVSRCALPMRKSCFEVQKVIVGGMSEAWQRARRSGGKPYYRGLDELVKARRRP